jgi:hypothetical protein
VTIASVALDRNPLKAVRSNAIEVVITLSLPHEKRMFCALLDSGANYNFINQKLMVEEQLQGFDVKSMGYAINKHPIYIYNNHEILTGITDASNVKREYPQIYYAAEIGDYNLLIGLSWLTELDPDIR